MKMNLVWLSLIAGIIGVASIFYLGHDNPVEEVAEEVIEDATGADVDLSPDSDEMDLSDVG